MAKSSDRLSETRGVPIVCRKCGAQCRQVQVAADDFEYVCENHGVQWRFKFVYGYEQDDDAEKKPS